MVPVGADANCVGARVRARVATRTCEGRFLAAAGVNLKSVSASALPDRAAASLGSALAGVKEETGSKLNVTAGACFFVGIPVAIAGVSTRPAAAAAATNLDPVRFA